MESGLLLVNEEVVKNEVLETRVEEKVDESKESEGDEVFEEAVEAVSPGVGLESMVGEADSGDVGCEAGNNEGELEKFEEAVDVPNGVQDLEESEGKVGVAEGATSVEEPLVTGDGMKEEGNEFEKIVVESHDDVVENGEEADDVGDVGEAENLSHGEKVQNEFVEFAKKTENGVMDHGDVSDAMINDKPEISEDVHQWHERQNHKLSETQDANEVKGGGTDQVRESNGDILHEDDQLVKLNGTYDHTEDNGLKDHEPEKNASAVPNSEHQDEKIEKLEDDLVTTGLESNDHKSGGLKAEELPHLGSSIVNDEDEKQIDVPAEDTSAIHYHEERESISQSSSEDLRVTPEVPNSIPLADFTIEKVENVQVHSSDLEAETPKDSQLPDGDACAEITKAAAKDPENSGLEVVDKKHGFPVETEEEIRSIRKEDGPTVETPPPAQANTEITKTVAKEPESNGVKFEKQDIPLKTENQFRSIDKEVRPAKDSPSSSGRPSAAPAPSVARPAGLGRAAPLLEPAPRVVQQPRVNGTVSPPHNQLVEDPTNVEAEENDETREKLQMIRVKFLRLARRLGQTPHNVVVAQVLYRLGLAEQLRGRNGGRVGAISFDRASAMAEQLEAAGQEPLDFSCTIMVLGKTGVGKSATINSIFDEPKFGTDAFQLGTKKVQDVVGMVQGIQVRVIDTPGLLPSLSDQRQNERILHSVKRFIKKTPPDIVLYLDRLDMQSRDFGDMPLLRTITDTFGPSIWFNAIVVLTHAASAPPEGPNGTATSYDMFVTQRSHVVQQAIRQAAGDMRLMNPVSLVENHSACRTNRAGQRVLPNGQVWKPHLLLLSFASKILAEANTLLKLQDSPPGKPYAARTRSPPLPFLLSSLLQSKAPVKLPAEQFGDDDDAIDDDSDESSDSEDESEYDKLPPFKPLTKAQLAKLSREQVKAYYDELSYREELFMKKQLKEEKKRRKLLKKMQAAAKDLPADYSENVEEDSSGAASVPVPMPDLALPASFDSDNPTHRYRSLDSSNQWLVRPVLEPNGWDHDVGYEGINVERLFVIREKLPVSFSGQVSKDKKDTNLQMEVASSMKHGDGKTTSVGFDMQSVGKDIAYTIRSDSRFCNYRKNKATAGFSVTLLGDVLTGGLKVEDKLIFNKRGQVVVSGGAMFGRGDVAYGGSLEATLRDKNHPLGRFLSTLGISVMDWHGDLAIGCNSQTQIPIGRFTNLIGRININNRGSGQVSIRLNSSEQLQIALISLLPLARKLICYSQPVQFG